MATIGSLLVNLGMDTAKFNAGIKKSNKKLNIFSRQARKDIKKIGSAFAGVGKAAVGLGVVAGAAFAIVVKGSFDTIDAVAKTADKLGLATEALVGLQQAATLTGVANKTLNKSLVNMARVISEASEGTGLAVDAFNKLGLSAEDLKKLAPEDQFGAIADAMQTVENQTDKVAIAYDVFGGKGVDLINTMKLGSAGLKNVADEAKALGIAMTRVDAKKIEDANDAMHNAGQAVKGVANTVAIKLAPTITALSNAFIELAKDSGGFTDEVNAGFKFIIKAIGKGADAIHSLKLGFGFANFAFQAFLTTLLEGMADADKAISGFLDKIPGLDIKPNDDLQMWAISARKVLDDTAKSLIKLSKEEPPSKAIEAFAKKIQKAANDMEILGKDTKETGKALEDFGNTGKTAFEKLDKESQRFATNLESNLAPVIKDIMTGGIKDVNDLGNAIGAILVTALAVATAGWIAVGIASSAAGVAMVAAASAMLIALAPVALAFAGILLILTKIDEIFTFIGQAIEALVGAVKAIVGLVVDVIKGVGSLVSGGRGKWEKRLGIDIPFVAFADGGISSGFNPGIVTSPVFNAGGSAVAGEAGPEAIIPLKGGAVPVELAGGGGGANTITLVLKAGDDIMSAIASGLEVMSEDGRVKLDKSAIVDRAVI
jgi:hypothetical protein